MATARKTSSAQLSARTTYSLKVFLIDSYATKRWLKRAPAELYRIIEIRSDQTLAKLHDAIFNAFDRFDQHLWEFQFGTGPADKSAERYLPCEAMAGPLEPREHWAERTQIGSLGLEVGQSFGYLFDFGDCWQHQITVLAVGEMDSRSRYPRLIEKVGESPDQYPDLDEEDDEEEGE